MCGRACVLLSLSAYSQCVGVESVGIDVHFGFVGRDTQDSGGVVAHKLLLSGVLCVYLIHDCL